VVRHTSDRASRKTTRSTDCEAEQSIPPTMGLLPVLNGEDLGARDRNFIPANAERHGRFGIRDEIAFEWPELHIDNFDLLACIGGNCPAAGSRTDMHPVRRFSPDG
jgi:hypothetical protein